MKKLIIVAMAVAMTAGLAQANLVYLADDATHVGGDINQDFAFTIEGNLDGQTADIVSGTTTLAEALTYTALALTSTTGNSNARFRNNNYGDVNYTFATTRDLSGMLFWNYTENWTGDNYTSERGITRADITITHDGGTNTLQDVVFALVPETGDGAGIATAQQIDFGGDYTGVTSVYFSDLVGGDGRFLGWHETAFTAIPEPATLGMIAAMGGGLLFIRRRLMM